MLIRFIAKLAANSIIVLPLLMWFARASFIASLLTAIALAVIAYLIGDLVILRNSSNRVATVADMAISILLLLSAASIMNWTLDFTEIATIVILLGIVEWLLHKTLLTNPDRFA